MNDAPPPWFPREIDVKTVASAHVDTFVRDRLAPLEEWPEMRFDLPELQYPARVNVGCVLADGPLAEGQAGRVAVIGGETIWTYGELNQQSRSDRSCIVRGPRTCAGKCRYL